MNRQTDNKKHMMFFRADDEMRTKIEALAKKQDRPLSSICRMAVEHYVRQYETKQPAAQTIQV